MTETSWFYEDNGQHRGPIGEADLAAMFANRTLSPQTRVWTAAFGNEWKFASQTHMLPRSGPLPPPLPTQTRAPWQQAAQSRPPAFGGQLTDKYAYWLAFSPLLMLVFDVVVYATGVNTQDPALATKLRWGDFLIGAVFAGLDARDLYRSGLYPKAKTMAAFILLTAVAYFWRRHYVVGRSVKFIFIWIGCFVVWALGLAVMME